MAARLEHGERGIGIGGKAAEDNERRGSQTPVSGLRPGFAQEGFAENQYRRRREPPEKQMNRRQHPPVGTGERPRVHQQTEEHDVNGQKAAHAETYQEPRRLRRIAATALHLVGDAAAITAELAALTVHRAGEAPPADRYQAVAAQSIGGRRHATCQRWCKPWPPAIGTTPRLSVIRPSARMKARASRTPRCRHLGATSRPRPPIASMAGKVPRPNTAIVRQPDNT